MATKFPASARATIEKYGDYWINGIVVKRHAIPSHIHNAVEALSKIQGTTLPPYDKLFHLGMVLDLRHPPDQPVSIQVDKNATIYVGKPKERRSDDERIQVPTPTPPVTLYEFLNKGLEYMGNERFFKYSAFSTNCQNFVKGMLEANGVNTQEANDFVLQDTRAILAELPDWVEPVVQRVTDTAAQIEELAGGRRRGGGQNAGLAVIANAVPSYEDARDEINEQQLEGMRELLDTELNNELDADQLMLRYGNMNQWTAYLLDTITETATHGEFNRFGTAIGAMVGEVAPGQHTDEAGVDAFGNPVQLTRHQIYRELSEWLEGDMPLIEEFVRRRLAVWGRGKGKGRARGGADEERPPPWPRAENLPLLRIAMIVSPDAVLLHRMGREAIHNLLDNNVRELTQEQRNNLHALIMLLFEGEVVDGDAHVLGRNDTVEEIEGVIFNGTIPQRIRLRNAMWRLLGYEDIRANPIEEGQPIPERFLREDDDDDEDDVEPLPPPPPDALLGGRGCGDPIRYSGARGYF